MAYLNEKEKRNIPVNTQDNIKTALIPVQVTRDGETVDTYAFLDEYMYVNGQVDAAIELIRLIESVEEAIAKCEEYCEACIGDGGGCGHIDRDEMAYLTCGEL